MAKHECIMCFHQFTAPLDVRVPVDAIRRVAGVVRRDWVCVHFLPTPIEADEQNVVVFGNDDDWAIKTILLACSISRAALT
jgi:hypothetical protein